MANKIKHIKCVWTKIQFRFKGCDCDGDGDGSVLNKNLHKTVSLQ